MIDIASEFQRIKPAADAHGVDPLFVAAIRLAESGGPGREFGVLSVRAATYDDQLAVAVKTLRGRLASYGGNPLAMMQTRAGFRRLVYSRQFVAWFASGWAPRGVANDPHDLNANWTANAWTYYTRFVESGELK